METYMRTGGIMYEYRLSINEIKFYMHGVNSVIDEFVNVISQKQ